MKRHSSKVQLLRRSRLFWSGTVVIAIIAAFTLWQIAVLTKEDMIVRLFENGQQQLELHTANLQGQLEKFEPLPELLAANRWLVDLVGDSEDEDNVDALNRYLESVNSISGASDTYLMDPSGLTIAASNWHSERPFIGRNFSYRPYFQEAMKGKLGRYFALGTTSNKRGFYFAYPIRKEEKIIGAVVVKLSLSSIEEDWGGSESEFIVTDPDGVVFLTTKKEWRFKLLKPISPEARQRIEQSRRYTGMEFTPLSTEPVEQLDVGAALIKIDLPAPQTYMVQERSMPEAGWRVHILTRIDPVHAEVAQAVFIVASLLALAILFFLLWNQRRKRFKERLRYQLETQRNREINEANTRLIQEIDERRRAEEALVQARDELIQATKLAALGEMSTGISHELNQPLAAIRAYADNARALIDHGRNEDALANLIQISDLTERMAQISSQLKIFARKGVSQSVSVSLGASIKNSLRILQTRIKEENVCIHLCPAAQEIFVLANAVQLEQVLVNLIGNALHAVEESEQRRIEISTEVYDQEVVLKIWDNGPGIEQDQLSMIFDPFFTTKKEGRGLGLGLSISHRLMDGMNGKLQAENHPEGGAVFTLRLPVAEDT